MTTFEQFKQYVTYREGLDTDTKKACIAAAEKNMGAGENLSSIDTVIKDLEQDRNKFLRATGLASFYSQFFDKALSEMPNDNLPYLYLNVLRNDKESACIKMLPFLEFEIYLRIKNKDFLNEAFVPVQDIIDKMASKIKTFDPACYQQIVAKHDRSWSRYLGSFLN